MGNFICQCAESCSSTITFIYYLTPNSSKLTIYEIIKHQFKTFCIEKEGMPFKVGKMESISIGRNKILLVGGVSDEIYSDVNSCEEFDGDSPITFANYTKKVILIDFDKLANDCKVLSLDNNMRFPDLPQPRARHTLCMLKGYLYVFGGENQYRLPENTCVRLNVSKIDSIAPQWELIDSPLNFDGIYDGSALAVKNRYIYLFDTQKVSQVEIHRYDEFVNTWDIVNYTTIFDLNFKIPCAVIPYKSDGLLLLTKNSGEGFCTYTFNIEKEEFVEEGIDKNINLEDFNRNGGKRLIFNKSSYLMLNENRILRYHLDDKKTSIVENLQVI